MAKVVMVTMGSLGDLYPFLAIGQALKKLGHSPVIVTNDIHQAAVESSGIRFHAMRPSLSDLQDHTGLDMGELVAHASRNPWFLLKDVFLPFTPKIYEDVVAASRDAALIVAHNWAFGAIIAAEAMNIKLARVALSPLFLQSALNPSVTAGVPYLPRPRSSAGITYNRTLRDVVRRQLHRKMAPAYALRRTLGLAETNADFVFDFGRSDFAESVLALYSPQLAALEPDHPDKAIVCGFPHFDGGSCTRAPSGLATFLDQGAPPVVLTLGSFVVSGCADFYRNGLAACRALGLRSVLIAGEEEAARLEPLAGPETFICAFAPHAGVFPKAAAIVHHGGIGTTGQAMKSGRPQLVLPSLGDQADNARRLVDLGIARQLTASRLFRRERCSVARMTHEIGTLVANPAYSLAARARAHALAAEDGAGTAARHLDGLVNKQMAKAA